VVAILALVVVGFERMVAVVRARRAHLVLLRAAVGDDPEVVVGELEIVLGQHAVAVERGVVREFLVLFEHLRRIAPGPAVDPVALMPAAARTAAIVATAAPAIVVAILVQRNFASLLLTGLAVA
jgi:hypothetical protein